MRIIDFLSYLQVEKRYPESTIKSYRADLIQFERFLAHSPQICSNTDVTSKHIRAWVVELLNVHGLAHSSIKRKISSLNTYFNWLIRKQEIRINPAKEIASLKLPKRIPQYLSSLSVDQMLKDLKHESDTLETKRNYLIIDLLYSTGVRRQELINLKWSDIETHRKFISVMGKGQKERQKPIAQEFIASLLSYKECVVHEFNVLPVNVFVTNKGRKLYPKFVYSIVNKYLSKYSSLKKRSPHILRHTFATHLLNNGAELNDIKELLGHSSLAATQIYTHNSIEDLKNIYKQAHPKS